MENTLFNLEESTLTICGTDEAGRGPLAGPVVAAAVVLPPDFPIEILGDSKKLSEKKRIEAERIIKERAVWATAFAMRKAYEKVATKVHIDLLLADGNRTPDVDIECRAIIKGDAKIPEIMAASILAKNERDRIMVLCDRKWPGYGYAKHKGYPSPEHRKRIAELGPSPIERMTFNAGTVTRNDEQPELF